MAAKDAEALKRVVDTMPDRSLTNQHATTEDIIMKILEKAGVHQPDRYREAVAKMLRGEPRYSVMLELD